MPKQVYIQIPKPCHESWDEMTANGQGAYCKSCKKTVIDFSGKTENEIYDIVTNAQGEMCGRFTKFQLQQPIRKTEVQNGFMKWRAIAASLAALFSFAKPANAGDADTKPKQTISAKTDLAISATQNTIEPLLTIATVEKINTKNPEQKDTPMQYALRGTVVDAKTREALTAASIVIKGTGIGTLTDDKGHFVLALDSGQYDKEMLAISYIGYSQLEMPVRNFKMNDTIGLKEENMVLGGMVGCIMVIKQDPFMEQGEDLLHNDNAPRTNFRNTTGRSWKRKE